MSKYMFYTFQQVDGSVDGQIPDEWWNDKRPATETENFLLEQCERLAELGQEVINIEPNMNPHGYSDKIRALEAELDKCRVKEESGEFRAELYEPGTRVSINKAINALRRDVEELKKR